MNGIINAFSYSLPEQIDQAFLSELASWGDGKIARVWSKDASIWTNSGEEMWLGWLDVIEHELGNVGKYKDLWDAIDSAGFTDVLLMGMGGSSLCPEVLALTFGRTN